MTRYYQYFCGERFFSTKQPCDASELVHFRHMIGETCMDQILKAVRRDQRFRNHPKNFKKARKADRRLRTIAGRHVREAERNLERRQKLDSYADTINLFKKVIGQKRDDKDKVYSLHEPEVKCQMIRKS